ncbi:phage tail tape measure protein [Salmonella enterica]|nr:phage tail tape measure protein [Salmonella enterica]EIM8986658.1 phage tail tape measure protein [Salmonella enterica]
MASNKNFQLAFEIGGKVAASLPKSFNVAHQAVAKLNSELTDLRKDQGEVQKLQAMKARVGQTALEYHKAAARVEELQRQISNTGNPTRAMIREFERAKTQSSNLRTSLRSQRDELASLKNAYGGADTSAKGLTAREKELKLSIDRNREAQSRSVEQVIRYKTALAQARTNILDAKRAQDELNRSLEKRRELKMEQPGEAKGQLVRSGVQTTAVAAGVFAAANNTANFNRENKMIGLTADMKPAEVQAMGQAMLVTGAATNQFASDIQAAQGFLVAAGQDYKEAQANLLTIGRTATATGSDILDVSKASFTLSDALKIDPSQMKTAMGILVQAGKEGNFEFKDMAKNLPVLGAQFQALKMGGNEAAATMGAALQIARKGASTSDEAANNMNNFMAKILSPETLKKAQKNFGVDMYKIVTSAQKKGQNPFEAAMKSVIKMTKNGDQKLLGELFGDMQVQNFVRPMIQNWEEYRRIKETSLGAGGAVVDRDFANITKDNAERLKQLRIQASNAALSFGQALQPALNAALGVLVPLLTKVSEFVANNPNLVSQIVLTAGVLLYQNWDKIKACAVKVWPTIREYGVKALEGLKFVFMNFTPVGWLVQAFKAGADILNTINWSDSGAKIIETLITGIKSKANALVDEVKGVFATVREYLPFSDAKRGPFSQLTKSGGAIMATLASGVNGSNSLQTAISGKFGQTRFSPHGISVAGGLSSRSGASGGAVIPPGGITYAPVINLPPGSPKETEAAVQRALDAGYSDFEKKMSAHLFQSRRLSFG